MIQYRSNETVPLPKQKWSSINSSANMGLVFNKYFPWKKGKEMEKSDGWTNAFISEFNRQQPSQEYEQRYWKMVSELKGTLFELECISDLIIGMGNAHPMENGFTFDHSQGLPFIPGTTIKGIWKAALNEKHKISNKEEPKQVDELIFLDAIPREIKMKIDIMTPHYQPYYASNGKTPPGDWFNPIPIQFVVISKGSKFLWGIIHRSGKSTQDAEAMLEEWLKNYGIGGKTAVGYGRIKMKKLGGKAT